MIIKPRGESLELKLLRSLDVRTTLTKKEKNYLTNLEKGHIGEVAFDKWLKNLSLECIVLHDILFETNNTVFQIDTLLLTTDTLYIFEVKNYEGDFYIEKDLWYTITKSEISNPLLQLKRSQSLLNRLLIEHGIHISVVPYLIFINPNFHLYQAPLNSPMIFSTQLNRFINTMNNKSSKLSKNHFNLAEKLLSIRLTESPYLRLPDYSYEQIKKGIVCGSCSSFIAEFSDGVLICSCGFREAITPAVIRSVEEFKVLFPDRKITTSNIQEWCNIVPSRKIINKILSTHYKLMGYGKSSYYSEY
ncbi:MAG: NERD domain-containing protein [Bacillaceae bacterium]|nr:NERD domain-containing protein [Bacillaceae bacterium]